MKIRSGNLLERAESNQIEFKDGRIQILADDGRILYSLHLEGSDLYIDAHGYREHGGVMLADGMNVSPRGHGQIRIWRNVVTQKKQDQ